MRILTALLLGAILVVSACGSDSGDDSGSAGSQATTTGTSAPGQDGSQEGEEKGQGDTSQGTGDSQGEDPSASAERRASLRKIERRARENLRKAKERLRKGALPPPPPSAAPRDAQDVTKLPVKQRAVYAGAAAACQIRGVKAIADKYGIASSDPNAVARGYAQKVAPGAGREAAYKGCLTGFKSGR